MGCALVILIIIVSVIVYFVSRYKKKKHDRLFRHRQRLALNGARCENCLTPMGSSGCRPTHHRVNLCNRYTGPRDAPGES